MATTCKLIAKATLSSAAATMEFTSIPGTYTDLLLLISARRDSATGSGQMFVRFNSSTSNYSARSLYGNGSSAASSTETSISVQLGTSSDTANTFNSASVYIPNYAGSTNKSVSVSSANETNATTAFIWEAAGLWSDAAAITGILIDPIGSGDLVAGSSMYLYGITKSA